jgi:hypothetical protein
MGEIYHNGYMYDYIYNLYQQVLEGKIYHKYWRVVGRFFELYKNFAKNISGTCQWFNQLHVYYKKCRWVKFTTTDACMIIYTIYTCTITFEIIVITRPIYSIWHTRCVLCYTVTAIIMPRELGKTLIFVLGQTLPDFLDSNSVYTKCKIKMFLKWIVFCRKGQAFGHMV